MKKDITNKNAKKKSLKRNHQRNISSAFAFRLNDFRTADNRLFIPSNTKVSSSSRNKNNQNKIKCYNSINYNPSLCKTDRENKMGSPKILGNNTKNDRKNIIVEGENLLLRNKIKKKKLITNNVLNIRNLNNMNQTSTNNRFLTDNLIEKMHKNKINQYYNNLSVALKRGINKNQIINCNDLILYSLKERNNNSANKKYNLIREMNNKNKSKKK